MLHLVEAGEGHYDVAERGSFYCDIRVLLPRFRQYYGTQTVCVEEESGDRWIFNQASAHFYFISEHFSAYIQLSLQ